MNSDFKRGQAHDELKKDIDTDKAKQELQVAQQELSENRGLFNRVTGKTDRSAEKVEALKLNLQDAQQREKEWMDRIESHIKKDEIALNVKQDFEKHRQLARSKFRSLLHLQVDYLHSAEKIPGTEK